MTAFGLRSRGRAGVLILVVATASFGLAVRHVPRASATAAPAVCLRDSYELVGADGGVFTEGGAHFSGSLGGQHIAHKIVAVLGAGTNNKYGPGYLLVDSAGIVYPFGLQSRGDLRGVHLRAPIVAAMSAAPFDRPNKGGYLMVAADGGVFAFGAAPFPGSLAQFKLPAPIVGITRAALTPRNVNPGFWLVDAVGHVYPLGDAGLFGDLHAARLSAPVVGMIDAPGSGPDGYLLATADGEVSAFGSARWQGDASHLPLRAPIVGITSTNSGYYLFAADGGVFSFGENTPFLGSMARTPLNQPITAMGMQLNETPCR